MLKEVTIQLTGECNRSCPYCLAPKDNAVYISDTDIETFNRFCKRENIDIIHVTGGEPSLHPQFEKIIHTLSSVSSLVIYSNLCKKEFVGPAFQHEKSIDVLANINNRDSYTDTEWVTINDNIQRLKNLGIRITFSHTFVSETAIAEEFDRIFQLMREKEVNRLRISQALAKDDGNSGMTRQGIRCLYEYVSENIASWAQCGYRVYFDCPVPVCYLPRPVFEHLYALGVIGTRCLGKLFVLPDLKVTHCYRTMDCKDGPVLTESSTYDVLMAWSRAVLEVKYSLRNTSACSHCRIIAPDSAPCGCPGYQI